MSPASTRTPTTGAFESTWLCVRRCVALAVRRTGDRAGDLAPPALLPCGVRADDLLGLRLAPARRRLAGLEAGRRRRVGEATFAARCVLRVSHLRCRASMRASMSSRSCATSR